MKHVKCFLMNIEKKLFCVHCIIDNSVKNTRYVRNQVCPAQYAGERTWELIALKHFRPFFVMF